MKPETATSSPARNSLSPLVLLGILASFVLITSHKSKREKDKRSSATHGGGSDQKSTNRHVYIEPGAKIDFIEDLRKKYDTAQSDDHTHKSKQLFWTKVATVFLIVTASFTGWQLKIAHDTYNAANRPYIGVGDTSVLFLVPDQYRVSALTQHGALSRRQRK